MSDAATSLNLGTGQCYTHKQLSKLVVECLYTYEHVRNFMRSYDIEVPFPFYRDQLDDNAVYSDDDVCTELQLVVVEA